MDLVSALGYLVARGPLDEWDRYATDVLGMQNVEGPPPTTRRYRMDDRAYRLIVEEGDRGAVALGFEVLTATHLQHCVKNLRDNGFEAIEDESLAAERNVRQLVRSSDPSGLTIELFVGAETSAQEFVSARGIRFVTGDMGMGHVFVMANDAKETLRYYVDTLGFRLSDTIAFDIAEGVFLHCNKRHHSLAFAAVPDVPPGVGHLMMETETLDAVGHALDRAEVRGIPITATLGKHTNDRMTSFYMTTPSGFDIEYGWDGRTVDDADWSVTHYTAPSAWGHKRVG